MSDITVVHGPVAPAGVGSIIYSVTLGNGYVVTNPDGFGNGEPHPPTKSAPSSPPPEGDKSGRPRPLPSHQ